MTPNQKAFLDMIAVSEIGKRLLELSDNGYDVLCGSTWQKPLLFSDYLDHPRVLNKQLKSTGAGRYQILMRIFDAYAKKLGLHDFSPESQDTIALELIRECKALDDIEAGNFEAAVAKCASRWASLPGSPYGQRTNKIGALKTAYIQAGGMVNEIA